MFNDLNIKKEHLPLTLPIFPLSGALLLPGIELPLNIFEPKYIKMVDDALAEKKLIGLVQPQSNLLAKISKNKPLHKVGCVGKIRAFNETDDGRYLIVLSGIMRFNLADEIPTIRGYRRFQVNYENYENDLEVKEQREGFKLEIERSKLFNKINNYLKTNAIDASLNNISGLDTVETGFLIDFLCSYLPFSSEEKQLFLEAKDLNERAKILLKVLGIAEAESIFANNPKTIH